MADIIQLLPDHVANQIAAGEVVQRPASVVKELVENAIDANATSIKLIVKEAGKTQIQVIDNGKGMSETDARLCFERHATSKIKSADDLFQLQTKGFRGEALASIAAIAHVELKTKLEYNDLGTAIVIEGSEVKSQEVVVTPQGTSISVKNLFFNIPARRNFLKSHTVELRHIVDEFHRIALAHPSVEFILYHNGSELFNLPKSNYRQRIVNVFGSKINDKLVPVSEDTEIVKITGFVAKPEYSRKTKSEQFFFVNNRFIKSGYLNHAVSAAFEGLLKEGYYPSYFLNLEVDPHSIDINIHPTKTEIKFEDEHTLYAIIRSAVKHSLGQFNVAPVLDFDSDTNLDTPYSYKDRQAVAPAIQVDRNYNPFKDSGYKSSVQRQNVTQWESLYVDTQPAPSIELPNEMEFESEAVKQQLFQNSEETPASAVFQLQHKYLVSSLKSGLLVVDQYRAHQRILYESFLKNMTVKSAVSQQLLFPLKLYFSSSDIENLKSLKTELEQSGFIFESFGNETIEISGVPFNVSDSEIPIIFEQLISDIENEVPEANFSTTDLLAKSMAKSLAVKRGQQLSREEQEHLLNSLFACKEPSVSPDNKPTFITIETGKLDKKFI
ncbi:DNA mismatch repair endonuclease MutL [Paucihalobacter ruber]|uniref:DNA mismatch repair protein MutL n=1 Tax=Paucihalobacter ruber TaxID=2567861 RepID=A0A506PLA3_9FLAO|nr:DNA mismatch repair endonuclease MutL [Paucihalobacter ruber]TPV33982.1 DNA mismatch repair endonuclease MutL [Paucihalobacter ruber]